MSPHGGEVPFSGLFSSIVGYHLNPLKCGVARFNQQLAQRLGVPVVPHDADWGDRPLLSLKWAEIDDSGRRQVLTRAALHSGYSVLWHDAGSPAVEMRARRVWSAADIGIPSLLPELEPRHVRLFSFGMAHKVHASRYRRVRELLESAGKTWSLRVSVALHEGTDLDEAALHFEGLGDVLGAETVTVLGCLTDAATREELARADVVCAFFDGGARANNTSLHAAMQAGRPVLTNLDDASPDWMLPGNTVMDLRTLRRWPSMGEWRQVAARGGLVSARRYSWDAVIRRLHGA